MKTPQSESVSNCRRVRESWRPRLSQKGRETTDGMFDVPSSLLEFPRTLLKDQTRKLLFVESEESVAILENFQDPPPVPNNRGQSI